MKRNDYPNLANLLGAYFHQDWRLDHTSYKEVLKYYVDNNAVVHINNTIQELEKFLQLNHDEKQIGKLFVYTFDCNYDPQPGMTYTEWLKEVLKILKSSIKWKKGALHDL